MTELEFETLSFISNRQPVYWTEVLNNFDPVSNVLLYDSVLHQLLEGNRIRLTSPSSSPRLSMVKLTPKGAYDLIKERETKPEAVLTSNDRCVDSQQCKTDVAKKRSVDLSSITQILRSVVDLAKILFEVVRLLLL